MLSRRSVRIKAMQILYAVNRDKELTPDTAEKRFWESIEDTFNLYLLNLYLLVEVSKRANIDMKKRKGKHLPTDEDKIFKDHLYSNSLIKNLELNTTLQKKISAVKFDETVNKDYIEKMYSEFSKLDGYKEYLKNVKDNQDHLNILLELYRFLRQNALYNETMEDHYGVWEDDKSVVIGAVKKTIKRLPETDDEFYMEYYPSDETVKEFGYQLFKTASKNNDELLKLIEPTLKNWDSERLAIVDMILLKMATAELIHFETIPAKVTLNEYIDLARNYSTAKSKEFINGVIDRIMNDLIENKIINKVIEDEN